MSVMEVMRVPTVLPEITAQEAMTLPGMEVHQMTVPEITAQTMDLMMTSSGDGSDYADEDSGDGYDTGY